MLPDVLLPASELRGRAYPRIRAEALKPRRGAKAQTRKEKNEGRREGDPAKCRGSSASQLLLILTPPNASGLGQWGLSDASRPTRCV